MKLITIILLGTCLQVSAKGYSQKISLSVKEVPLTVVFEDITKQSGYRFFYNAEQIVNRPAVSLTIHNADIHIVLDAVFSNQPLTYEMVGKVIVVKLVNERPDETSFVNKDPIDVKGKVVNEKGEPVEGVSVRIKGKNTGTSTDSKGEFVLKSVPPDGILVFTSVNIQDVEWKIGGKSEMIVNVKTKVNQEQEVAVVVNTGYQNISMERTTGSFSQINNELFNRRTGPAVLDRIIDHIPGLLYKNSLTGNPLDNITIRGISTINSDRAPLLVVDNFIYDGDINSLNPNDIESVTVLKDAAAASIWGVRAGNGVIVMTTKKGKFNQKPRVSIRSDFIIGMKPDLSYIPAIPSKDIVTLEKERFEKGYYDNDLGNTINYPIIPLVAEILNKGREGLISQIDVDDQLNMLINHDMRNDIKNKLLQNSMTQQYALNVNGGIETYRYYGSMGYTKSRPNQINNNLEQVTLRFNNTWKPVENLEISTEINWAAAELVNKNMAGNFMGYLTNPYSPLIDTDGNALPITYGYRLNYQDTITNNNIELLDWHYRPLDEAKNGNLRNRSYDTRISGSASYTFVPGLFLSFNYQWQNNIAETKDIQSTKVFAVRDFINRFAFRDNTTGVPVYPIPLGGIYNQTNISQRAWNFRTQLNYNKILKEHAFSALIGFESRETVIGISQMPPQYGYNSESPYFVPPLTGTWVTRPSGDVSILGQPTSHISQRINRFGSYFSNMGYTFNGKYTLTASARIDKSNFFGVKSNDRTSPLWHAGTMWDLSKEKFFRIDWINSLILRASYGYNGNTNAGTSPFATAAFYEPVAPLYTPVATLLTAPNPQLRWEKVRNVNYGVDFEFFNQRIKGSVEYYIKQGIDLISKITVDPTSGFTEYVGNNASIKGKGLDITLNWKNFTGDFAWQSTVQLGYNVEKVTSYLVEPLENAVSLGVTQIIVGQPLNYLASYKWAGLDPANGDSRIFIGKNIVNSKEAINAKLVDLVYSGRTTPSVFGSFRNDFSWKNVAISFLINYRFGYYFRRSSFTGSVTNVNSFQHKDYLNAWKKSGDETVTNVPAFLDSYPDLRYDVYQYSDILVEKGDHIRLQDIRISYDLVTSFMKKTSGKISIYSYMNNVGILWKANKHKIDPDAPYFGNIPNPKSISLGVQVNF